MSDMPAGSAAAGRGGPDRTSAVAIANGRARRTAPMIGTFVIRRLPGERLVTTPAITARSGNGCSPLRRTIGTFVTRRSWSGRPVTIPAIMLCWAIEAQPEAQDRYVRDQPVVERPLCHDSGDHAVAQGDGRSMIGAYVTTRPLRERLVTIVLIIGCGAAGLRGCGAAGLRGCGAAGLPGCGAAGLRGCRAAGLPGCRAAGLPGCRAAGLRGCRAAGHPVR
ncbi:hypothetical protein [Pseudonocardia phyllosphaerae]|uniref:hypothetical protein n=1 Tax=Pseudonocardia phyllosphaerae TaxID=3390502 RepID=UPI00397C278F